MTFLVPALYLVPNLLRNRFNLTRPTHQPLQQAQFAKTVIVDRHQSQPKIRPLMYMIDKECLDIILYVSVTRYDEETEYVTRKFEIKAFVLCR